MNFKKLIAYSTLAALLTLNSPANPKQTNLGKICNLDYKPPKCVTSLEIDLDADDEDEYLTIKKTTPATAISEFCGYTFIIKDIDYIKDRVVIYNLYNIVKVDIFSNDTGRAYIIKLYKCTTESEEAETGIGEPEIIGIEKYIWTGERLMNYKEH